MSRVTDNAKRIIDQGGFVFPVDHPDLEHCAGMRTTEHDPMTCTKRGKHNTVKYTMAASNDPAIVPALEGFNYGIYTPKSNFLVLDEDKPGAIPALCAEISEKLPRHFESPTSVGRFHHVFELPSGLWIPNSPLAPGIDVRASADGYIIGPGSKHASGVYYGEGADWSIPLRVQPPNWLIDRLLVKAKQVNPDAVAAEPYKLSDIPAAVIAALKAKEDVFEGRTTMGKADGRNEAFYYIVAVAKESGMRQGQVVTMMTQWSERHGKFVGRADEQVATIWAKLPEYRTPAPQELVIRRASDFRNQARSKKWVYTHRILEGELTLLAGDGKVGKSTLALLWAAKVTTGTLEGNLNGVPRDVIYVTTEEDWLNVIIPKFEAAGGDLNRFHILEGRTEIGSSTITALSLPDDLPRIEGMVKALNPGLIIIDPLTSIVDAKLSENANKEMRQALEPYVKMCQRLKVGTLGIAHFNKNSSTNAAYRIIGSIGIANLARSILFAIADKDTKVNYCGLQVGNYAPAHVDTLKYEIMPYTFEVDGYGEDPIETFYAEITGVDERHIERVMKDIAGGEKEETRGRPDHARNAAEMWLMSHLRAQGGEAQRKDMIEAAKADGHSQATVERALANEVRFSKGPRSFGGSQTYKLVGYNETPDVPEADNPLFKLLED